MTFKIGQRVKWLGNDMVIVAIKRVPPGAVRILDADVFTDDLIAQYKAADNSKEFVFVPGITVKTATLTTE